MFGVPSITVEELKEKQSRSEAITLLDVREPNEWAISDLAGSVKIPLGSLPQRFSELPAADEIVVYCRSGARSAQAVPGPACYGNGGSEPTNTDANLVLGILPERGLLGGRKPLSVELARRPQI